MSDHTACRILEAEARAEALEECAKLADDIAAEYTDDAEWRGAHAVAEAIRERLRPKGET